jgi:hypothetical protein
MSLQLIIPVSPIDFDNDAIITANNTNVVKK